MNKPKIEHPKVFISYAWTSDVYVNKVAAFASSLIDVGIDVLFDKFEMKPGNELNDFMERSVKDPSVTNVLLLLNRTYQEKADKRQGGVGKETQILSEELYNHVNQTKIIPVVFEKGVNGEIYKPAYLGSTFFVDLVDFDKYDSEFQLLVKSIYGETVYRKPELGKTPSWITDAITFDAKVSVELLSLKNQSNAAVRDHNFRLYLDRIKDKILTYKTDDLNRSNSGDFYQEYLNKYNGLCSIRNEFLELVKNSVYVDAPEKKIASFFEKTYNGIKLLSSNYSEMLGILLHELFIYVIAYFIKNEMYAKISYILGKTYCVNNYNANLGTFSVFSSFDQSYLDAAVCARDGKKYLTGTGSYWIENINVGFCSTDDFVLADVLCFNYFLYGAQSNLDMYWFPVTYVYGGSPYAWNKSLRFFSEKLKTKEFLKDAVMLFNYDSEGAFILQFKEIETKYNQGELREFRYRGAYYSAPVLCQYVKSDELGKYR